MQLQVISPRDCLEINGYKIYATKVDHSVPAYGYIIENSFKKALVYTGDTGPTHKIWKRMHGHDVRALIIEVSFPDEMLDLALKSGHLTPSLLQAEIEKMEVLPERIYITHLKPYHKTTIQEQLARLKGVSVEILEDEKVITV